MSATCDATTTRLHTRLGCLSVVIALSPLLNLLKAVTKVVDSFRVFGLRTKRPVTVAKKVNRTLVTATTNLYITVFTLIIRAIFTRGVSSVLAIVRGTSTVVSSRNEEENV